MVLVLKWIKQNYDVPKRKLRERLSPIEFYDEAQFLVGYQFTKGTILEVNRKVGQTVKHLLVSLRSYTAECF